MELREVRTFRAVADYGSLSKAADYLHISQPALSRHIKQLEKEVRKDLFTRDGRGMRLTPAGEFLYARTQGLLSGVEHLRDDVRSFEAQPSGDVVLGVVPTVSARIAVAVAVTVLESYPEIRLRVLEGYTGHLTDWMNRGELDIAVMYRDGSAEADGDVLFEEQLCAIGTQPVVGDDDVGTIGVADLLSHPLVLPSPRHPLRSIIEAVAQRVGVPANVVVEADSYAVMLGIAATGRGVAVVPQHALTSPSVEPGLIVRSITDAPFTRTIALFRNRHDEGSAAIEAVVQTVTTTVAQTFS